jgi:uncharacterized RDD family membrane protein YckC
MTCPSCGGELVAGADRCPVCDVKLAPRVEGALATDPRLVTPAPRPKAQGDPIREIPALRRRESKDRSWRDEVQERVRSRRQKRVEAGLPLFDDIDASAPATSPAPAPAAAPKPPDPPAPADAPLDWGTPAATPFPEKQWQLSPTGADTQPVRIAARLETLPPPAPAGVRLSPEPAEAELPDLSLPAPAATVDPLESLDRALARGREARPSLELGELSDETESVEVDLAPPPLEATPVERPARALERAQAAAVDLALFSLLAVVVVYFAGRAARVELAGLLGSWPWVAAYLGLLAVFYASYFTGTTGQTPGKLLTGLRVVGVTGRPPAYARAAGRALLGLAGVVTAGLGLVPMAFDPAARALHDRLFRTRVVRG